MQNEFHLQSEDGETLVVRVHPDVPPTTSAEFHPSATHVDFLGMPTVVRFDEDLGFSTSYHPTPCCGASASISDPEYGMYCKACYEQVDPAFGNAPQAPFRLIEGRR